MTYLQFHLVFMAPPLLLLAWALRRNRGRLRPGTLRFLPLIAAIAVAYTTPWDNHLVRSGIWWYGEDRVLGTIGWVPVEEYVFFVLQPLLTGTWLYVLLARGRGSVRDAGPGIAADGARRGSGGGAGADRRTAWLGAAIWAAVAGAGAAAMRHEAGTYLGLILVWAGPVLALQWAWAGERIWRRRRTAAAAIAAPTLYLWAADRTAIGLGIWTISERHTTGLSLFGLPVEEALFFLLTNVLVVQGLLLFLHAPARGGAARARTAASVGGTAS